MSKDKKKSLFELSGGNKEKFLESLPTKKKELVKLGRFNLRKAAEFLELVNNGERTFSMLEFMGKGVKEQAKLVAKGLKKWKKAFLAKPIMDNCDECNGTGEVQMHCENCDVPLTEGNLAKGAESFVCVKCEKVINAVVPN